MKNLLTFLMIGLTGLLCFGQKNNDEIPILVYKDDINSLTEIFQQTQSQLLRSEVNDQKLYLNATSKEIDLIKSSRIYFEVLKYLEISDSTSKFGNPNNSNRSGNPYIYPVTYSGNPFVGEQITLYLKGQNNSSSSTTNNGYLTMSLPNFANVESYGGDSQWNSIDKLPAGESIWTCYGNTTSAAYVLVDGYKEGWAASEIRKIWAKVTPISSGTLTIYAKMSIGDSRYPSGNCQGPDQQYWPVKTYSLTISNQPVPNLVISPTSWEFSDTQAGATSATKTFTVTNNGNATATGCAASLSSNSHFTITSPTGSFNVAAGASVSVKVTFNPQSAGSKTANLQIGYPGGTTLTSSLEGYGYQPQLTFSLTTWNAGSINVGQSVGPQSILLTNTGSGNAKGSVSLQNGTNFSIASGGGDFDLNANASKTITVIFQPQSSGEHSDYLNAKSLTNSIIDDVQLQGTGTSPQPNLSISPSSFDFGETQAGSTSAIKTFTVTNNGNATATGCAASLSSNAHFTITSPTGSFNVAAGASVSVKVTFNPQSAGSKTANLQIGYPGGTTLTSSLEGYGYQPQLTFSLTTWNAGSINVGQSVGPQSILLTNTGSGNAKGSVSLQNGTNFSIASGGGDFDLNANASKTITVIFQPQSSGEHSDYLNAKSLTNSIIDDVQLLVSCQS